MEPRTETMLSTDPRRSELEAAGWRLAGESWGARLRLPDPPDLSPILGRAAAAGFDVMELDATWIPRIVDLERLTHADYPDTPATRQPQRSERDVDDLYRAGTRFFGAANGSGSDGRVADDPVADDPVVSDRPHGDRALVALTAVTPHGEYAETEFTSVDPIYRRRGLARAVKSASIVTLAGEGVRTFGTGGAQVNAASIGMNESLGYVIEERWVTLEEPVE